jgi:DNA-binding XRE family transcriptional regulator
LQAVPKIIEFLGYDPLPYDSGTLGEKLLQYRKSRGIDQKELAERIGIDPTTLSRLERNKGGCFPMILKNVSAFLNARTSNEENDLSSECGGSSGN